MEFKKVWGTLPVKLRKTIVLVIGSTLIVFGAVLIVLPGPFTMPFIILGLVILSLEFVWAESLLIKVRHHARKAVPRKLRKKQQKFADNIPSN